MRPIHHALRAALLLLPLGLPARGEEVLAKVLVDRDGVVRVTDRELTAAGRVLGGEELERLALTLRGDPVPLRVRSLSGGAPDGRFALEFAGSFPRGTKTWEDEFTTTNVYVLSASGGARPARVAEEKAPASRGRAGTVTSPFTAHHEVNRKLVRFTGAKVPDESWFWHEIKATDKQATSVPISADAVAPEGTFTLKVRMVGYSHLQQDPDHTVDVTWNGVAAGKAVWDGESAFTFEKALDPKLLKEGENVLTLHAKGETTKGVDLVLLDWVELTYQRRNLLGSGGQAVVVTGGTPALLPDARGELAAWSADGARVLTLRAGKEGARLSAPAGAWRVVASPYPAHAVVVSRPMDLAREGNGADFVILSHERFLPAARRLAAAREAEGLKSLVVPIGDVYDRFAHGFFRPEAIRDFLRFTHQRWSPKPRYALLVGDASWDYKNANVSDEDYADWHWSPEWARQVPKNGSTPYRAEAQRNDRLFVPTHQWQSPWGHAADDNWFAVLSDGGNRPDLAIGRLTVATAQEAEDVVTKILGYGQLAMGTLQEALFITNDEAGFQRQTDVIASAAEAEGYKVVKVYPRKEEKDNRENTKKLLAEFDSGPAFVLFNGHGGRYIWRTGPPDLAKNHDLFTLDHLDQLADRAGFPVVVSLTCYSAPFDHPVADSIGEKLLRLPRKGAVAVIASSWRNAPPLEMGRKLLQLLGTQDHPRIGDAFLAVKRDLSDPVAIETYNLLGDPTTPYRGLVPATAKTDSKGATNAPSSR